MRKTQHVGGKGAGKSRHGSSMAGTHVHILRPQDCSGCWGITVVNKTKSLFSKTWHSEMRKTDKKQNQIKQNTFEYSQAWRREEKGREEWETGPGHRWTGTVSRRRVSWRRWHWDWYLDSEETVKTLGRGNRCAKVQRWAWTWHIQVTEKLTRLQWREGVWQRTSGQWGRSAFKDFNKNMNTINETKEYIKSCKVGVLSLKMST